MDYKDKKRLYVNAAGGYSALKVANWLTKYLWDIIRPDSVKHPDDVTKELFPVYEESNGDVYIEIDAEYEIKRHIQADTTKLLPLLDHLSLAEKTQLKDYVRDNNMFPFKQIMNYFGEIREPIK